MYIYNVFLCKCYTYFFTVTWHGAYRFGIVDSSLPKRVNLAIDKIIISCRFDIFRYKTTVSLGRDPFLLLCRSGFVCDSRLIPDLAPIIFFGIPCDAADGITHYSLPITATEITK